MHGLAGIADEVTITPAGGERLRITYRAGGPDPSVQRSRVLDPAETSELHLLLDAGEDRIIRPDALDSSIVIVVGRPH